MAGAVRIGSRRDRGLCYSDPMREFAVTLSSMKVGCYHYNPANLPLRIADSPQQSRYKNSLTIIEHCCFTDIQH